MDIIRRMPILFTADALTRIGLVVNEIMSDSQGSKIGLKGLPTSETLLENPIPLEHIQEYDDLQSEAARRAWAQVEKEHGKEVVCSIFGTFGTQNKTLRMWRSLCAGWLWGRMGRSR
jgi:hypothetical protein